jgi:excisionase family DNA binding protein
MRMAISDGPIRHRKLGYALALIKGAIVMGSHKGRKRKQVKDIYQSNVNQAQQVFAVCDAAKFLHLSQSTVRRLIKKGGLRAVSTNGNQRGRILISRQALMAFLGDDDGGSRSVAV